MDSADRGVTRLRDRAGAREKRGSCTRCCGARMTRTDSNVPKACTAVSRNVLSIPLLRLVGL